MHQFIKYVGLDTHKDTIAVAIADTAGGKPRYYGEIANTPTAVAKLITDVSPTGEKRVPAAMAFTGRLPGRAMTAPWWHPH